MTKNEAIELMNEYREEDKNTSFLIMTNGERYVVAKGYDEAAYGLKHGFEIVDMD